MRIESRRTATAEEWDHYFEVCPASTYFHGREWSELWSRATGGRLSPAAWVLTFSDGVEALLPLTRVRHRVAPDRFLASPAGTYGGWLYTDPSELGAPHVSALAMLLGEMSITVRENPFDPVLRRVRDRIPWTEDDFTQTLRLDRDFSAVQRTLRRNQVYRKARQAERAGLRLDRSHERGVLRRYYEIYEACRKRWGSDASNRHPRSLFEAISLDSENIDVWVIRNGAAVIGVGAFFQARGSHVVSWLTLADPTELQQRPYDFIYARLIEHYHDLGFLWFDFNPSGGHEGVVRFKDNFGPDRLESNLFHRQGPLLRAIDTVRAIRHGFGRA